MSISFQLVKEISTKHQGNFDEHTTINEVFIDSRKQCEAGLFIPIVGERFDGHDYVMDAIHRGAVSILWQKDRPLPSQLPHQFPIFFVDDTRKALAELAKKYLKEVSPIVVGITGSNGKTTTKDLLQSVLVTSFKTHKTAGNFNNDIGLPLTVLAMPKDCQVAILEMGMNHFGEISFLSQLAEPDYAIITNIGESHIEQLGSRAGIAKAKMEIVDGLKDNGCLIIDGDEPLIVDQVKENVIKCGYSERNDYKITDVKQLPNNTQFTVNNGTTYKIEMLGAHNVKNSLYAIAVGTRLGINETTIQKGLSQSKLTGMRMEKKIGLNGSTIINDAYNSSPTSMKAAIETVKQLQGYTKKIVVLGDMYELGANEEALHRSVANVIAEPITHVITVGSKGRWIAEEFSKENDDKIVVASFEKKEEVGKLLEKLLDRTTIVLVKASRGMQLETIVKELSH